MEVKTSGKGDKWDHYGIAESKPLLALACHAIAREIQKEVNKEPGSTPPHNKGSHLRVLPSHLWYLTPWRNEWEEY